MHCLLIQKLPIDSAVLSGNGNMLKKRRRQWTSLITDHSHPPTPLISHCTLCTLPSSEDDMMALALLFLNYTVIKNMTLPLRLGISGKNVLKKHPHVVKAWGDDLTQIYILFRFA
jgi:hypothetical protein